MDGSYNQPFGHGQAHGPSHLNSPQTPSSATYQTNVNRSKTRKWVEARQQTYDGDDWGTDDFDQEPDSPPHHQQQQPPVPASSRLASYGQRTPSGSVPPPAQPSALHIPPQQQAEPPAQVAYMPANAALSHGPGPSSMASPSQLGAQDQVVSPQHLGAIRSPAAEPQSQHASAPVHGSWQDSAMPDPGHLDHLGHIGRKNTTRKPVGGAMPVSEGAANNSTDAPAEPANSRVQGPSADIGTEHGVENVAKSSVVAPKGEVVTAQSAEQGAGEGCQLHEGDKIDRQRLSTSPQLPDVARMSAFGADLFAADQKRASTLGQAPREEPEAEQAQAALVGQNDVPVDAPHHATNDSEHAVASRPEAPKGVATSDNLPISSGIDLAAENHNKDAAAPSQLWLPSVPGEQTANQEAAATAEMSQPQQQDISPVSEQDADTAAILNAEAVAGGTAGSATLQPAADEPTIAPLRTPSPRAPQMPILATSGASDVPNETAPLHTKQSDGIAHSASKATRDPEYSPSDYEPKSLQREATFSTVTSSPLKESDILRDEIIKSLSPRNDTAPEAFPPPTSQKPVSEPSKEPSRESTYTLSGYDSYWAEGQERSHHPAIPEESEQVPAAQAVSEEESAGAAPVVPVTSLPVTDADSPGEPTDTGARRRFSWEAEGGATAPVPAAGHEKKDEPHPPVEQVPETALLPTGDTITEKANDQGPGQEPASDNVDVSHQVSQASTNRPQEQAQAAALDPPSPVSNPGDRNQVPETSDRRPSLAEQKSGVRSEATPVAPSPPAGAHPALASPTGSQNAVSEQPLMTFREIMSLPGSQERISKYDEARTRFATIESGLSEWIANLKASHPDHANATAQFNGSLAPPGGEPARVPSPMGSQAPSQQPYYQQYLNASSPTSSGPGKRLGGLSVSGQSASSAFGHSSDKIGTKGKEFMQSAGKMGKGLFSKGKSKLRGTGDKNDTSPPISPVQGKVKADRRSSWALSLGNRSRAEGMGKHTSHDRLATAPTGHSPQPSTLAGGTSMSARPPTGSGSLAGNQVSASKSGAIGADAQHSDAHLPPSTPTDEQRLGHSHDVSLPLTLDKEEAESSWDPFNGTPYAKRKSGTQNDVLPQDREEPDSRVSGDWVVVPREIAAEQSKPPQAVPEDSGVGMTSQPTEPRMVLRRDGSFGLPLISRSNTSDFGFQDALGLGDQTETPTDQQAEPRDGPSVAVGAEPEERRDAAALVQQAETQQDEPPLPSPKPEVPRRSDERARAQATLPHLQTQSPVQNAPRPPGPWKLEESYLSEPLHQVSRKRSGTSDSQNVSYGLDKEMGITSSPTSSTPVMGPRQRGGNQLPPSSAQRYPELFTTAQAQSGPRGRSNSGSQIAPAGFPRTQSNEFDIPGVGPPEDRGRRKSSGIFKEFGNRLARASSRDRRPSTSDNRAPTSDNVRSDVASETSVWTENNPERRSKRSSLLSGLRKRPSMDMAASVDDLRPPQAPMANQSQAFGPSASQNALPLPSEEERKSKSGLGGFSTDRFKLRSSRTERWDSNGPNGPNGPNGSPAPVDQPQSDHGAGKSRLSGLGGKVVGLAGAFRRPQSEQSQAAAAQDHNEEARQVSQQHLPSSMAPPPPAAGQQQERRRRPSASGLLSGFVGKVSSRTGEQQQQPTGQPQQQGLHTGMRPDDMPSDMQMHAGRASMDHRPSVSNSLSQQGPPQAGWGPDHGQYAQQASREPGIPPQSVDPRSSIGQSPSPEISRKDALADGERFDTVSPELSVRSGPQNPPAGQHDEDARNLQQFNENRLSHHPVPVHMNQQRQGVFNQQGSYSSGRLPPGQNAQQLQPQQQQPVNGQAPLGSQNAQSSGFFRPQSSQPDALNVPGSRHSSMSLSQSSTQGRPQGEGSRWRGLKNRIGAQLAASNQTQERPGEKDERSGKTKLFGAFKRSSKQPSGPPVSMHQQAGRGQQWGPQDAPHPGPQGQAPGQPPHAMGYDPRNIQQGMVQPGQQHLNQSGGQLQRPAGDPNPQDSYQYQRQPSMGGSTGQKPQVFPQNHVQAAGHPAQQPQQQMQREKQYEQVPIPGPYGIVTGQGNAHNMDRQMRNYATSFQYNNAGQSSHPGQGQHAQQHQRLQSQGAVSPPPDTQNANVDAMSQAPPGFETRRPSDAYGTANPVTRAAGNIPQVGRTSPEQGQQSFLPSSASPPPQSALPPPPSAAARPSYPREDSEVLPSSRQAFVKRKPTVPNGRPTAPHETPVAATQRINDEGPKNNANLSVDVAKAEAEKEEDIYDATPRVVQQDKMGPQTSEPSEAARSSTPTAPSPAPAPAAASTIKPVAPSPEVKKVGPDTGKSFAMELEDTEEARKRTIRLDSQEEKIYYDPADDDDNPTMSATSYPGQEWNPYGEFEYSDIGDDAQNEGIRGR